MNNSQRKAKHLLTALALLLIAGCASVISGDKAITSFAFLAADNAAVLSADRTGVISGTNIAVSLPKYTDRSSLVATFTSTGVDVKVGGVEQESGVTPRNFGLPVDYVVTASDGTTQRFTVTVDSGDTKLISPGNLSGELFGRSVSIAGDYAIVGAPRSNTPGYAGNTYVFHGTGPRSWDSGVQLVSPGSAADDCFGCSVSISGDYAIVGASGESSNAGAAYIFHRVGTNTWDAGAKLVASDAQPADWFGASVSISGDYAIVGARGEDTNGSNSGAAYIFRRTDTNAWDPGVKLVSGALASDYFGGSVSIDGDYAIVGARWEDEAGADAGAAHVFYRTGPDNLWSTGDTLVAPDAGAQDYFGCSVSISGDYALVGADWEDTGASEAGAAYVFHRTGPGNAWDTGVRLVRPDTAHQNEFFGCAVSISGDTALVGAYGAASLDGTEWTGAAYEYGRTGANSWDGGVKFAGPDVVNSDNFGSSVSLSGGAVIVGSWYKNNESGAAYIWE